ncbi:MAG: hypothetical protein ACXVQR_07860 [Solirubrobacteraceae bacterium]
MRITERDRALLGFVAEHRLVLASHVRALLGTSLAAAYSRLAQLARAGFVSRATVFDREPGCYQLTRSGLAAIDSRLPPPRLDLRGYRHDVGVAWLWLAAQSGAFGEPAALVSERRMRSEDGARHSEGTLDDRPHGVRLGGVGAGGRPRLHYPDLVLVDPSGHRIAIELELSAKGRARREGLLAGYAADPRIDAVLYLCADDSVARGIRSSAARVGVSPLIHVQRVSWRGPEPATGGRGPAERRAVRGTSGRRSADARRGDAEATR